MFFVCRMQRALRAGISRHSKEGNHIILIFYQIASMFNIYKNIRVLDASRILVGPYATMMLGDLGAQVIKVESFEGDETRQWGPPFIGETGCSTYFLSVNRNKKSISINLKHTKGKELFHQLARKSDIVVENFNLGVTERLGIDYEAIRKINPAIIYASINGFGSQGPLAHRSGFDFIVQAASGLMSITGEKEGPPTKIGIAVTDIMTAMQTCNGIQAALYRRAVTGEGCHIQTSLFEAAMASLMNVSSNYLNGHKETQRIGNMHPSIVPYGVYRVRDQHMMLAAATNAQFISLCDFLGIQAISSSPLYKTNAMRVANRDTLKVILEKEFSRWEINELCDALNHKKIPASKINSIGEAFRSDQVTSTQNIIETAALGIVQTSSSDKYGQVRLVRSPLTFDGHLQPGFLAPPLLNEHRDEILETILDYSADQIRELIEDGILKE